MDKRNIRYTWITGMLLGLLFLCGCQSEQSTRQQETVPEEKNYSVLLPGTYDSKDTAVLLSKNDKDKTLTFFNLEKERNYTLEYDGTTKFYDKYDSGLALSQVPEGSIVDVTFLKESKKLNTLRVSKEAWSNSRVKQFDFNENRKSMTVGGEVYKFSENLVVMQESRQMELMDINAVDVLTVNGIGNSVHSVQIEQGHGYLRLSGDEYFIGGWIEVGQSLIQEITEGMLLTVPEGTYNVEVSHNGFSGIRQVTVNRNEETTLDISDLKGEGIRMGTILFTVNAKQAKVFVDGKQVDISAPVELEYGIHQLMAKAEGYKTSTSYLKVAQESAAINIVLDEEDTKDDSTDEKKDDTEDDTEDSKKDPDEEDKKDDAVSDNDSTVSGSDIPSSADYYKIYIDNPTGVEVYLNGNYVGVSPVSFKKTKGMHVITLRKKGYETRSYTINVGDGKKDASYSFVELEKE